MGPNFKAIDHGKGKIKLSAKQAIVYSPTELHHKEDGALGDLPSFAIVMYNPYRTEVNSTIVGEISLETLTKAFSDLGYVLTKK